MMFGKRYTPDERSRPITKVSVKRAKKITDGELPVYADTVTMALAAYIDQWRFHDGPASDVALALDALNAVWNEVEIRGLE